MSTIIYVNCGTAFDTSSAPWSYNFVNTLLVAQVIADLKDDANANTGYTLDITSAFKARSGSSGTATSGAGGWPEAIFDYYLYVGSGTVTGVFQFGGLTENDTFSIELAGHQFGQGARDAKFTVSPANEGQTTYDNSADATPTAPITFTGTIGAAGTIDVTLDIVSVLATINGMKLTITPAAAGGVNPKGVFGMPFQGPFAGPIG